MIVDIWRILLPLRYIHILLRLYYAIHCWRHERRAAIRRHDELRHTLAIANKARYDYCYDRRWRRYIATQRVADTPLATRRLRCRYAIAAAASLRRCLRHRYAAALRHITSQLTYAINRDTPLIARHYRLLLLHCYDTTVAITRWHTGRQYITLRATLR